MEYDASWDDKVMSLPALKRLVVDIDKKLGNVPPELKVLKYRNAQGVMVEVQYMHTPFVFLTVFNTCVICSSASLSILQILRKAFSTYENARRMHEYKNVPTDPERTGDLTDSKHFLEKIINLLNAVGALIYADGVEKNRYVIVART